VSKANVMECFYASGGFMSATQAKKTRSNTAGLLLHFLDGPLELGDLLL
jgi:hypothetical protein